MAHADPILLVRLGLGEYVRGEMVDWNLVCCKHFTHFVGIFYGSGKGAINSGYVRPGSQANQVASIFVRE
jgi:hypothetical protein